MPVITDDQKKAVLDVITMLKTSFDIKDNDQAVIVANLTDKEKALESQTQELQRKEREFRHSMSTHTQQLRHNQNELRRKQHDYDRQVKELTAKIEALNTQERLTIQRFDAIKAKEQAATVKEEQLLVELEKAASMSRKDAVDLLCTKIESEAKLRANTISKEIINEATQNAQTEAKRILAYTIQKESTAAVTEFATASVDLVDDSFKGKIIGREGRNIKTFEELTGTTVLIDDTPETVIISCYDPVRREIAKISMTKLIADGRIHPQRIEEVVAQSTEEFENNVISIGRNLAMEFHITDLHVDILKALGKLKYRTSFSQNVLDHCKEVALITGDIAAELKLGSDIKLLIRAGLLHDIGKVLDRNVSGPHATLGADFLRQHGECEKVCTAVATHHDNEIESVFTWIVKTADTISSARPGARLDAAESYIRRLQDLEKIVSEFEGVKTSFAVLAGRELRVIVEPEKMSDDTAAIVAEQIKDKIQKTMTYPGQIKVVVIRETRHVQMA